MEVQQNNKRNNRFITYKGKTQTIAQWSKELDLPFSTIKNRMNRNLSPEKILSKKYLCSDKTLEERMAISERVKKFMADPIKKENWKKSLSKRNYH